MENLECLNPATIFESIVDGSLADQFDKRLTSAFVALVGAKLAYKFVLSPLYNAYKYMIRPSKNLYKRYEGGWVVITGASDGIGLGFSKSFAKRGFNVLMISRNQQKLDKVAQEVRALNDKIKVDVLEFNFNRPYDVDQYKVIYDKIDSLDNVSVLINNVGYSIGSLKLGSYHMMDDGDILSYFNINLIPAIHLTKFCLNQMVTKSKDKKCAVITVSSISSLLPSVPGAHLYTGSKVFLNNFMASLSGTPVYSNVDFLTLTTASVKTNMNRGTIPLSVTADDYAEGALRHLGYENQDSGHWKHALTTHIVFNPIFLPLLLYSVSKNRDSLGLKNTQKPVE